MKIQALTPTDRPRLNRRRAFISIRSFGDGKVTHTVTDTETGERTTLPAKEAWSLHQKLNMEV